MAMPPVRTESLCPHCLHRIEARRIGIGDSVYLEKSCPEHGDLEKVLLWKEPPWPYETWNRPRQTKAVTANPPPGPDDLDSEGCPYECGICRNHEQATCTAILEITHACNLTCPVCFAGSKEASGNGPSLNRIEEMLETVKETRGICPLQLSGGEPTLRNDLPQIVTLARKIGFDHIQINTNGIRLAQDFDYGQSLKDAGTSDFFLQFDGCDDAVYSRIRGAALWPMKLQAVERCAELKVGIILVPTLVRNVNESQIGTIIQFAKKWIPTVKGVHFQPMTYLGRYPESPHNEDRILIPDILMAIEEQTEGELRVENMVPPT
jgi:7,8-dihydro-6-hydroxymethylpterin dimethyltransferase